MVVYAKVRSNDEYHSLNIANSAFGFMEMGAEVRKYQLVDEIIDLVTSEDIVLDYIDQCLTIFNKLGVVPECDNYPKELCKFLGRSIWHDTIDSINANPDKWGIFVKPIKEKAFTGRVIREPKDLIGCGSCYENYEVLCSDIIDIKREFRAFIVYDRLVDIRPYAGDWHYNYDSSVIDSAVKAFIGVENRPMGCSLDFAVTGDGKTVFLEMNDGYALGCYGLHYLDYAKLISARWSQLLSRKDEFDFRR